MTEKFKSKSSSALIIGSAVAIGLVLILPLTEKAWAAVVIIGCVGAFALHIFATTYYIISGSELKVRCSFLVNIKIDVHSITKITPSSSVLSAPALSLDRLEIFYNRYDSVMISPEDKAAFIASLKAINPQILLN